jgi:SAM-dependent methyltransferase
MNDKDKLIEFYSNKSKHSNYQVLPSRLKSILDPQSIQTTTRSELERLKYITSKIDFKNKTVLDIGANTGYFSFELLDRGAKNVHYYEGNKEHAEFVGLAAKLLGLVNLKITNGYYNFDNPPVNKYDICLLFNVLHHVGDDYGDDKLSINEARAAILKQLNNMSRLADDMVFQMGFNWQGDVKKGLFENGTKKEMIDFVTSGVGEHWDIVTIGVAQKNDGKIEYRELDEKNIERDDSLGEFLNRPIFILKSKKK